jgi:hypothetical protein
LYLAPYGIWWVGGLSWAAWCVPASLLQRQAPNVWVGVAVVLALYDLHQHTHYLASWLLGFASVVTMLMPLYAVFLVGRTIYRRGRTPLQAGKLIGLAGYAGAGKDAAAAALVADGWTRVAFADRLKLVAYDTNPLVIFSGQPQRLQAVVDTYGWDAAKQEPDVRALLQNLGTNAVRRHLGADVWINAVLQDIPPGANVVITDVRFPNEIEWVKRYGGVAVRVARPGVGPINQHLSEAAWDDQVFDAVITNDSNIAALRGKIRGFAQAVLPRR